jgi:hypothetical protein
MNKLTIAKTHKHPWASSKYSTVSKQKHWPCELERCRAKASFFSSSSAFEYDYNLDQESYKPLFRIKILFVAYAISLFLEKDVAVKCTSVIRSLAGITVRFPVSFHNFRLQSLSGNFIDCPYADPINMTQMWRLLRLLMNILYVYFELPVAHGLPKNEGYPSSSSPTQQACPPITGLN